VPTRRFIVAVLVSLALHLVAAAGGWLRPPAPLPAQPVLEARLERASPLPTPPLPDRVEPAAKPAPRVQPRPRPLALPPTAAPAPFAVPQEPEPPAPFGEALAEPPAAAQEPEPQTPPAVAETPETAAPQASVPARALPRKGRIVYAVHMGTDGYSAGRTVQSWEIGDRTYSLASVSETTGFVDLFRPQRLVYLSRGSVTARGLRPEQFLMSRTRRGRTEEARARFDREAGTLTFGRASQEQTVALAEGAQDIVSFMYHLALAPPAPGRIVLPVTNGYRYETYEIDVLPEETIETPMGQLRALPLRQVHRQGAESLAVWLAVEYRHLPVRVRFFDREGHPSGELVASEIAVSED
jgi:hypothetical protein